MSDSLRAQLLIIVGSCPSGHMIHWRAGTNGRFQNQWLPVAKIDAAPELIRADDSRHDTVYLACAPRAGRDGKRTGVERVFVLWADCDTDTALDALEAFAPRPSLLVASGGLTATGREKTHCYWRLQEGVERDEAHQALRRLRDHLGSDAKCAEPARVLRPATCTWRKDGRSREVALRHVDLTAVYPLADVMAAAGESPAPDVAPGTTDWTLAEPSQPRVVSAIVTPAPMTFRDRWDGAAINITALETALKRIPPPVYVPALTGREPDAAGKIECPFHDDWNPSFHAYETPERGWACFQCGAEQDVVIGGSIIDLGARLYGIAPTGADYPRLLTRLAEELLA